MTALSKAMAIALVVFAPAIVHAQSGTTGGVPPAPVGHRQPTAGDSIAGQRDGDQSADPVHVTPQEQRDDAITKGICSDPTC